MNARHDGQPSTREATGPKNLSTHERRPSPHPRRRAAAAQRRTKATRAISCGGVADELRAWPKKCDPAHHTGGGYTAAHWQALASVGVDCQGNSFDTKHAQRPIFPPTNQPPAHTCASESAPPRSKKRSAYARKGNKALRHPQSLKRRTRPTASPECRRSADEVSSPGPKTQGALFVELRSTLYNVSSTCQRPCSNATTSPTNNISWNSPASVMACRMPNATPARRSTHNDPCNEAGDPRVAQCDFICRPENTQGNDV